MECEVTDNCNSFIRDNCWYCDNYSQYNPKDPKVLCKRQVEQREIKKLEKKKQKETVEHKQGKAAVKKGEEGEKEIVRILNKYHIKTERVKGSGRRHDSVNSCDVKLNILGSEKRGEVKRVKNGYGTLYKYLSQDKNSNMVFMRADRKEWLVCMTIKDFINLFGGLGE